MSGVKFSQFTNGGNLIPGDQIAGLRAGANTLFTNTQPQIVVNANANVFNMATNTIYISNYAGVQYFRISSAVTWNVGDVVGVVTGSSTGWTFYCQVGITLNFGANNAVYPHYLVSANYDGVFAMCTGVNTFTVYSATAGVTYHA